MHDGSDVLALSVSSTPGARPDLAPMLESAAGQIPAVGTGRARGDVALRLTVTPGGYLPTGSAKRTIMDRRRPP